MKRLNVCLIIIAIFMTYGIGTAEDAFHSGGGGDCGGCHNIHNSSSSDPTGRDLSVHGNNIF
jgi:hypothetical protein